MFNFNTFFQNIIRIIAPIINVVNNIVQQVTGGEGSFAAFMQTFTQNVNAPTGPNPEEIAAAKAKEAERIRLAKAQAIQKKADAFDQQADTMKLAREVDSSEKLMPKPKLQPQRAITRKGVLTSEMEALIDLGGTPILATIQNLMMHEREIVRLIVSAVGSVDAALSYMLSGWSADEDAEFDKEAAIRYVQSMLQTPVPTSTPTPFNDPCSDITDAAAKRQCYVDGLGEYSVQIMNQQDIENYPEIGNPVLEEFNADQLKAIRDGVRATGEAFAAYFQQMGMSVSPEEAFKLVYGETIEFGYVPNRPESGLTVTTGNSTASMDRENPIYILLDDSSFGFPGLDPSFVVVHELGHAFANRHGGKTEYGLAPISAQAFVDATGSVWYPAGGFVSAAEYNQYRDIYGELQERKNEQGQNLDARGNPTNDPNQYAYTIHPGFYYALGYGTDTDTKFFHNELDHPNPSEGFADTFANFILNPDVIPIGTTRRDYFEENMPQWIVSIICRDGGCDDDSQR